MKTRLFAALLAVAMSMTLFVGCEGNGGKTTVATTTTTEETTTTTEETTTTTEETTTTTEEETTTTKKTTTKKKTTTTSKAPTTRWTFTLGKTTEETTTTAEEATTTAEETTSTRKTVPSRTSASSVSTKDWSGTFPVKVNGTIEERAAAVNNDLKGKQPIKLPSEKAAVTSYNKDWAFTHHPGLAYFKGKWYASFTQGIQHEDAPGQRVVVCSSEDFINWSEPVVIGPALPNTLVPGQLTANVPSPVWTNGEKLFITYGAGSYGADKFDEQGRFLTNPSLTTVSTGYVTWTEDGETWSEPTEFGYTANDTLRQTVTGRWFASYGTSGRFSDELIPNGLIWESKTLTLEQKNDATERNGGAAHTESSWFQTDDHVLHIMVRSDMDYLWMMESYDNGDTWTDLYPTNFKSASTMWKFGELPDGRIFGIGTSGDRRTSRAKLELWISEDGINFDTCYILRDEEDPQQQQDGWAKGGNYGYPSVQIRDGYLHVLYSRHKEFMEVTRVKLSDIQ